MAKAAGLYGVPWCGLRSLNNGSIVVVLLKQTDDPGIDVDERRTTQLPAIELEVVAATQDI